MLDLVLPSASTLGLITVAAAACVPISIAVIFHINSRKPPVKLPYDKPWPVLGNTPDIIGNIDRLHDYLWEKSKEHGKTWAYCAPALIHVGVLFTVDPAVVEHILKTNFDNYVKGSYSHNLLKPLLGSGIFNVDGDHWKWQRKLSSHIFTGRMFRDVLTRVFAEEIDILIELLREKAAAKAMVDLNELLLCLTMDGFGKIAFSVDFDTLRKGTSDFAKAFDDSNSILMRRFSAINHTIEEFFLGTASRLRRNLKIINKFAADQIAIRRKAIADGTLENKGYRDLLDLYMETEVDGKPLTDQELRDMILNMIIAGRDTTAVALSWCFWELSSRREIVEKIRQELDEVTGGSVPTFDQVVQLKYLNAVFLETLRLYPSVPIETKISVKEDVLPGGIVIPPLTEIEWLPWAMGRTESIWGPDACDFRPERWIDAEGKLRRETPYKFPAFNAGPRTCLGQQMATVEGVMVMAALCLNFDLELAKEAKVEYSIGLTLNMKHGLKMHVKNRQ
ncbi:hypothetical protein HDU96_000478 [Phlyctochytrium bullatum]|nr:hypothetical protein HDU96_000478 [Phlyctochytrium bullatum]